MNSTINWRDIAANGWNSEAVYVWMWRGYYIHWADRCILITFDRRGFSSPWQTLLFIQMTINLCDNVGMLLVCIEIMQIKAELGSPLLCRIESDIEYDTTSQEIVGL